MISNNLFKLELEELKLIPHYIQLNESIIDELKRCIYFNIHENYIVQYGFMNFHDCNTIPGKLLDLDITKARGLTNGINSFIFFQNTIFKGLLLLDTPIMSDEDLMIFHQQHSAMVALTDRYGVTKIATNGNLILHSERKWTVKPNIYELITKMEERFSTLDSTIFIPIINKCLYSLSSKKIGATIVILVANPRKEFIDSIDIRNDLKSLSLYVLNKPDLILIESLLATNDGACLFNDHGYLQGINIHLKTSDNAVNLIASQAGTRHSSAQRFSYDHPECFVFTVSSDGPVSIFSDGIKISEVRDFQLSALDSTLNFIKDIPEKKEDATYYEHNVQCTHCGKISLVRDLTIIGWKEHESVECELCGNIIYSANCFMLEAKIIKKI